MVRIEAAIAERARKQLGLITSPQLAVLGCTRHRLRGLCRKGLVVRLAPGVFAIGGAPPDWQRDVYAAVLAAGVGAAASHRSAACLWPFDVDFGQPIEIVVPRGRHIRSGLGKVRLSTDLAPADVTTIGAIPVTTKIRTIIDVAGVVPSTVAECLIDVALRDGLVQRGPLERRARALQRRGRAGPGQVLQLLGVDQRTQGRPESWLERRYLAITKAAGLPTPVVQRVVTTADGTYRADIAYEAERLIVEVQGHRFHGTRAQLDADAERAAKLAAEGWTVIHVTYSQITERPDYVVALVAQLLEQLRRGPLPVHQARRTPAA